MTKNTINLDGEHLAVLKKIARLNGNDKPLTQDAVNIGLKIACDVVRYLDDLSFKQVTNLNK
jgi:hypothetical protein